MDLKDLGLSELDACIETSIGRICLFKYTLQSQRCVSKKLDASVQESDPKEFAKALIKVICFPEDSLEEGRFKPSQTVLSDSDIESLQGSDVEEIAKAIVEHNPSLYRKREFKHLEGEDGKVRISVKFGEVDKQKEEGETFVEYLHRLSVIREEGEIRKAKSLFKQMKAAGGFSNEIGEQVRKMSLMAESLRDSSFGFGLNSMGAIPDIETGSHLTQPNLDLVSLPDFHGEQMQAFAELKEQLDDLRMTSRKSAEFMGAANDLQTDIAVEIKKSSDANSGYSKWNLSGTIFVIVLTGMSIAATFYSSGKFQANVNDVGGAAVRHLGSIDERIGIQNADLSRLKETISIQIKTIDELQVRNDEQKALILQLQSQLNQFEKRQ